MNKIFVRETDFLKEIILHQAAEIERRMTMVMGAIAAHDVEALKNIIALDTEVDDNEIKIEEECLKVLALHQPVAKDLRYVVTVMKINNDLERVGDILTNIADRGCRLEKYHELNLSGTIQTMGTIAGEMLRESLACLISLDVTKALDVIERDDLLDELNVEVIQSVVSMASKAQCGEETGALFLYHSMSRDLERIGDHATNIAEDVAYLANGWIIRHGNKHFVTGTQDVERTDFNC